MKKLATYWELKEKFDILVDFKHYDEYMIMAIKNHKKFVIRDTNGYGWFAIDRKLTKFYRDGHPDFLDFFARIKFPNCQNAANAVNKIKRSKK